MIEVRNIGGFNNKLNYTSLQYPQCSCSKCPNFYFNMLGVASRGTGKTYTTCQLIKHWEQNKIMKGNVEYELRTILISPTIQANEIFTSLKSIDFDNDTYDTYSDDLLLSIVDDIKTKKKEYDEYLEYCEIYKKFMKIKTEEGLEKLYDENPEAFQRLEEFDFAHYNDIPHDPPKVNVIILDDMMGSNAFSVKHKSALINLLIKNRHNAISFIILSQSLKSIPKSIRLNCNVFYLAGFKSKKVITDDLYEEVSNILTTEQFEDLYTFATERPYGSLVIDCSGSKKRFLIGWDKEMIIDEIEKIENK